MALMLFKLFTSMVEGVERDAFSDERGLELRGARVLRERRDASGTDMGVVRGVAVFEGRVVIVAGAVVLVAVGVVYEKVGAIVEVDVGVEG